MKKSLLSLCLALLLVSCGSQPAATPAPAKLSAEESARVVLDSKAFSEELEVLDADIAAMLYGLEEVTIAECAAYLSTGATAEECTFLVVEAEEAARTAAEAFRCRVEEQTAALENYQPAEVSKLEQAIHGYTAHEKGYLVYLVVAEDTAAAQDAVSGLIS